MIAVGYAYFREGLFTAATMCINVIFAGLIAFNFWEPLANLLDSSFQGTILAGYEDAFVLVGLFCVSLGLLRLVTHTLANAVVDFDAVAQQGGGVLFGLLTGYLVSGFMACVLQTLPWHENFMAFEWDAAKRESPFQRIFPPDRVWLAMMRRAGAYPLSNRDDLDAVKSMDSSYYDNYITFDKYGTFEIRYARFRRYGDKREKLPDNGEFTRETHQGVK
jgi:hypothetical protein